ncbi:hypothetical protein M427DRAFT_60998 [Gonapodya prolifera JEL478]|uniref:Uncharacterized protein n=1 Tax=Gonapodya prolifera (strain JEL478) TaxID=1344416 RepID=A0A139A3G7_GONPJ|nr:hypothetical protein M427DRAFT_60998 [Gonapodya prolifera JEL478]|eukprot:KXS11209.1 hypothetical protein M427DRAFT_60998 [Gonapodya prolifera JEL478]
MAAADAALSHPHPTTQNANGAYIVAMAHLLSHPDDSVGAWTAAKDALKSRGKGDTTDAAQWLDEGRTGNLGFDTCRQNMGFQYTFVLAFYHLFARVVLRGRNEGRSSARR